MARRIARDAVIEIQLGGFDDGSTPTWGTAQSLTGIARSVSVEQSSDTVNLAGIGDFTARIRASGPARQRLTIEGFNSTNSFGFYVQEGANSVSPVGYRAQVRIKPHSSLAAPYTFTGIIREWRWNAQVGQEQVEHIEIEGPYDA